MGVWVPDDSCVMSLGAKRVEWHRKGIVFRGSVPLTIKC